MDKINQNTNNEETLRVEIIETSQNIEITTAASNIEVLEHSEQVSVTTEITAGTAENTEFDTESEATSTAEAEAASAAEAAAEAEAASETETATESEAVESEKAVEPEAAVSETAAEAEATAEPAANSEAATAAPEKAAAPIAKDETVRVIGVRFRTAGKVYYFDPGKLAVRHGSHVIVETARGVEYGTVVGIPMDIKVSKINQPLKEVIRVATREDTETEQRNRIKEKEAYRICQEKIRAHGLDMKLINAEYTFDNSKVLFYFTSDGRVDFRDLVKDLAGVFRTRIELRQIGVRDETKILGGYGICGRPLCCHTWMSDFIPVSIKMAKEQNLSLNPGKISGVCGRLMCCLKNEADTYEELNRSLPKVGDEVQGNDGLSGQVESVNVLRQTVRILVEVDDEKEYHEYHVDDINILRRRRRGGNRARKENTDSKEAQELEKLEDQDRQERGSGRQERGNRQNRGNRQERQERGGERSERQNGGNRQERQERGEHQERGERSGEHYNGGSRQERNGDRQERGGEHQNGSNRQERSDRNGERNSERGEGQEQQEHGGRRERGNNFRRNNRRKYSGNQSNQNNENK